ncbi:hypothetical protein BDR26DRAFT_851021 [Obelidium mucronatum]|nr:hypothetical protein BDR26DRAFT_851021 [Obelidium mucronatum]
MIVDSAARSVTHVSLLVVGASGVGKSALVGAYSARCSRTAPVTQSAAPTLAQTTFVRDAGAGVYVTLVEVGGHSHALLAAAARDADAVLLVYDVANAASFAAIDQLIERIEEGRGCVAPMVLVGNKVDTVTDYHPRTVKIEEGQTKASRLGIPFRETTAKAPANVYGCFSTLIGLIQELYKANIGTSTSVIDDYHRAVSTDSKVSNSSSINKAPSSSSFGALELIKQWRLRRKPSTDSGLTVATPTTTQPILNNTSPYLDDDPHMVTTTPAVAVTPLARRFSVSKVNKRSSKENLDSSSSSTSAAQSKLGDNHPNSQESALSEDDERYFLVKVLQNLVDGLKQPRRGGLREQRDLMYATTMNGQASATIPGSASTMSAGITSPATLVYSPLYSPAPLTTVSHADGPATAIDRPSSAGSQNHHHPISYSPVNSMGTIGSGLVGATGSTIPHKRPTLVNTGPQYRMQQQQQNALSNPHSAASMDTFLAAASTTSSNNTNGHRRRPSGTIDLFQRNVDGESSVTQNLVTSSSGSNEEFIEMDGALLQSRQHQDERENRPAAANMGRETADGLLLNYDAGAEDARIALIKSVMGDDTDDKSVVDLVRKYIIADGGSGSASMPTGKRV